MTYLVDKTPNAVQQDFYRIVWEDPFIAPPVFLADMQTCDGANTGNVRYANKDSDAVDVLVQEEKSLSDEVEHSTEIVGTILFTR